MLAALEEPPAVAEALAERDQTTDLTPLALLFGQMVASAVQAGRERRAGTPIAPTAPPFVETLRTDTLSSASPILTTD